MDIPILITVLVSFLVFLILQFLTFRYIKGQHVFTAMVAVFAAAGVLTHLGLLVYLWNIPMLIRVFVLCVSVVLYGLLTLISILAVFGIIESSLRIRLLREIVASRYHGITEKGLLKTYNREVILTKRLNRFIASGDLVTIGKQYRLVRRISFYLFPASVFLIVWKLYRGRHML